MDSSLPAMERTGARTGSSSAAMSPNRISADLERRSAANNTASNTLSGRESADPSFKPISGSRPEPPTPPGSPVDRPFPATMLPPPPGASSADGACSLPSRRAVGDGGGRRGKSESNSSGAAGGVHGKIRRTKDAVDVDGVRQPSDGYQVLDDNQRHDGTDQRSRPDDSAAAAGDHTSSTIHSVSSDSGESSSECDWSQDDGDSSDDNSEDGGRAPREAADGMSSDTETECLL